ncbi:LuxR C-terminal-related transcriptional regulator [Myroides pelagicus]|uniref:PAS domain-containing protein n=1 Tax=Myroides pelagicus TaxID=270914 RepID=A0A7K1GNU5_9FLAO|nr:LuxR C-terminal-related transcriptional regulator [Myroides pelagicus]MEC4115086.1 LuxR C-terminal-related transcriptional regulator [Myroides pelagicus]MTH30582.1 PAS domain-containing protein [Myroides pelagicus]
MKTTNSPSFIDKDCNLWLTPTQLDTNDNICQNKHSYYFIVNCQVNNTEYISSSILEVLGYSAEEFNMNLFTSLMHPDDLDYRNKCEYHTAELRKHVSYTALSQYLVSYSFRLKTKQGHYITIKQEYQTIETDKYGRMLKNFVHHEIIEDYKTRPESDFQIIDKQKNRCINFNTKFKLTKREVEILDLIHEGYQSKEISDMLNISHHTTQTHRKNILSKTKCSSLIEVLKKIGA